MSFQAKTACGQVRRNTCKNKRLLLAVMLATAFCAYAADDEAIVLDLPAQSLAATLAGIAKASHTKLIYADAMVQGLQAEALQGRLTVRQALEKVLSRNGLQVDAAGDALVIVKANDTSSATLPKVKVLGNAVYDVKDPYNEDYVLPNATSGTKTDTPIMETPLNVQVISKQVLKDQQIITLADALKNVSGVTINTQAANGGFTGTQGGTATSFTLRGFTSETFFRDGMRLTQGAASRSMANIEAIEVLKGSAAILYGLVEPGGMVNVITKKPLATPYYSLGQQFGSYDLYRTTMDATGPITQNKDFLYRMNISYQNSGSYREFVGTEDVFMAPVLQWNISQKTQATFELEYDHKHQGLDSQFVPTANNRLINIPISRNYGEYAPAVLETIFGSFTLAHKFSDDWSIKNRFSVNQQSFDLNKFLFAGANTPTTVYRQPFSNFDQYNTYSSNTDITGHFNTLGLKHTLLLGGDYYQVHNKIARGGDPNAYSTIDLNNPVHPGQLYPYPIALNNIYHSTTDQFGLYAQDQIKLPYDVFVTGGLRYQYIHSHNSNISALDGLSLADGVLIGSSGQTQDAVTPRAGILWKPDDWLSLYGNYTESFGANQGLTYPNLTIVPPTSAEQYEGGVKTEFFDGRLRATLAYYDLTKTNVATTDPNRNHFCNGGVGSCSIAIGAIRSRGPELDIQGEILPGWNITASYSNTDAIVTKSANQLINLGSTSLAVGSRMVNVPRNIANIWTAYEFQETELKGFKFGGGVTMRDAAVECCDSPAVAGGVPAATLAGYATVGIMAGYHLDVGKSKITAQINVDNLLDKHYYTNIGTFYSNYQGSTLGGGYADFGMPRSFMGSIGIQY